MLILSLELQNPTPSTTPLLIWLLWSRPTHGPWLLAPPKPARSPRNSPVFTVTEQTLRGKIAARYLRTRLPHFPGLVLDIVTTPFLPSPYDLTAHPIVFRVGVCSNGIVLVPGEDSFPITSTLGRQVSPL